MTHKPNTRKRRKSTIGNSVVGGLRHALAYERGELEGQVDVYNVPPAVDVQKIREKIGLSQAEFANRFGFNRRSLQDWEQGRRMPA